jgi:hypothetical protein
MNWEAMFTSDYMKAIEFGSRVFSGEIAEVRICKLEDEKTGKPKDKGVVFFKGQEKGWVLCKTNAMCLAAMFGPETDGWTGKHVTLFSAMVMVGKERKPGIRVKGSSDLTEPVPVEIKLPRRKLFTMQMEVTGKRNGKAAPSPEPEPEPEPIQDPETGETF